MTTTEREYLDSLSGGAPDVAPLWRAYWAARRRGRTARAEHLRDAIAQRHSRLALYAAARFRIRSLSAYTDDDAIADARLGIWKAVPTFDPARGAFSNHALWQVRLVMRDTQRSIRQTPSWLVTAVNTVGRARAALLALGEDPDGEALLPLTGLSEGVLHAALTHTPLEDFHSLDSPLAGPNVVREDSTLAEAEGAAPLYPDTSLRDYGRDPLLSVLARERQEGLTRDALLRRVLADRPRCTHAAAGVDALLSEAEGVRGRALHADPDDGMSRAVLSLAKRRVRDILASSLAREDAATGDG